MNISLLSECQAVDAYFCSYTTLPFFKKIDSKKLKESHCVA